MPRPRLTRCPFHPLKALRACPCRHLRCEKHPSVLKVVCACHKHLKVDQSRFTKQVHIPRIRRSLHSEQSIAWSEGVVVICGHCGDIATDYSDIRPTEHTARLVTFIRTNECKHCGGWFVEDEQCPKLVKGYAHERRYLVRVKKVAACPKCSLQEQIEVDREVFDMSPQVQVNQFKALLKKEGLI